MRIAYICADPGVPIFGHKGASVHVQEIVRAFLRQGATVETFAAHLGGSPASDLKSVRFRELPILEPGTPAAHERARLAMNGMFQQALEHAGPFDMVYERCALWSLAGMAYARGAGIPGVLEVNAPLVEEQAEYRTLIDRPAAEAVEASAFSAASAIIAVSEEVAVYVRRVARTADAVHVIPNGVNPNRFHPSIPPSRPATAFTVGFVGSMKSWHGVSILVEAFDRLHHEDQVTRLLLVGDGPEVDGLDRMVTARGLRRAVAFAGAVPPEAVPGLLASMDVATAPYPDLPHFYFSPLKVFEYMAAGRPVVASRIGQLGRLIRDGENGLLVPAGDAGTLARTLAELKRTPDLRRRLGQAARAAIMHASTWEAIGARILQLAGLLPAATSSLVEVMR